MRIERISRIVWITACLVILFYAPVCASGNLIVLGTSERDVDYVVRVRAQDHKISGDNAIRLWVESSVSRTSYTAYEGTHKRHARYHFIGTREETITVNGQTSSGSCVVTLMPDGMYTVTCAATFSWESGSGKAQEGFPRFRATRVTSDPMTFTAEELAEAAEADMPEQEEEKEAEPEPLAVNGRVEHTDGWEANRRAYNQSRDGPTRAEDVFWPGEKLIVKADVKGDGVRKVTAAIDELALTCELQKEGGEWMGILFHEDMMTREDLQTCTLLIRFTVYGDAGTAEDRVPVHMDGRDPYYRMHRKE